MKPQYKTWTFIGLTVGVLMTGTACQKKGPVASSDVTAENLNLEMVHFDFDKYNIRAQDAKILDRHATWLSSNPRVNVIIEGNTDEWGTEEYNLALGERRAVSAKSYLSNLGISADRLSTVSYGESRPLDGQHNEAAWAMNRRDEFKGRK